MNKKAFNELSKADKLAIYNEVAANTNLLTSAVEKDCWVVRTLEFIFETSISDYTVFKGGTSLSKAWGLIDRFSEDIDIALDRRFLGFDKSDRDMTGSQVSKLRKQSLKFITEKFFPELEEVYNESGFSDVKFTLKEIKNQDEDPITIIINYPSITEVVPYIQPRILIEIGSRSLIEPFENRSFKSIVGGYFKGREFADIDIIIPSVIPQRTFLEKIFLLHEEFQRPIDQIRIERKSRHLYDLEKLMDTNYAFEALENQELFETIVEHRKKLTPIKGIDYSNHKPQKINIIPPDQVLAEWEKDYNTMRESMIYNQPLSFAELMIRIHELNDRVTHIQFAPHG